MSWEARPALISRLLLVLLSLSSPLAVAAAHAQSTEATPSVSDPDRDLSTFAAGVEQVVVDVVVTDAEGEPVRGLTLEDFSVREEGRPQAIASFEAIRLEDAFTPVEPTAISTNRGAPDDAKRSFVLVFDDLNLTPGGARRAKHQLQAFLKTIFRPGDLVTLVPTAGGGGWSVQMPEGGDDLLRVLDRFQGRRLEDRSPDRISDYEAMMIHVFRDEEATRLVQRRLARSGLVTGGLGPDRAPVESLGVLDRAGDVYAQARERTRVTLEVLSRILRSLASLRGRKAVILVSEGFIHDTDLDEFRGVSRASWAANANLYFLNARGLDDLASAVGVDQAGPATYVDNDEFGAQLADIGDARRYGGYEGDGSNSLAVDSGGFTVQTNDLSKGLFRIVRESRSYYLLGYQPTDSRRDGKFRKIQVEVKRPGLELRARKGYYAPSAAPVSEPAADAVDPVVRAALDSPYPRAAIPLRMTAYLLGPAGDDRIRVVLAGEADPAAVAFEERSGRFGNALQSFFQVSSREREPTYAKQRQIELDLPAPVRERMERTWIPVTASFDLPEGTYQAALLLRDQRSGRIGTLRHQFEVPPAGAFRISTPILTDTFMADPAGGEAPPRPVPLARRSFASGLELVCVFDVFGARLDPRTQRPSVVLRYGVRREDGPPATLHAQGVGAGTDGQLSQRIKVPLRGAPPGSYEIVLEVQDDLSGQSVERRESFEIAAPAEQPAAPAAQDETPSG